MRVFELLWNLWVHINRRRRIQLVGIFFLTLLSTVGELASIGAVVPFLAALTAPDRLMSEPNIRKFLEMVGVDQSTQIIPVLTLFFILAVIIAGIARYFLMWAQTRVSFWIGSDIAAEIYHRTLYQPYEVHVSRNSSDVISAITIKVRDVVNQAIAPIINIVSALFLLISISVFFFIINPIVAIVAFTFFGGIYFVIAVIVKRRLVSYGDITAAKQNEVVKNLQEGLMGIRDVLLTNSHDVYFTAFRNADKPMRDATASIIIISQAPRYAIEAAGMILVAVMAYTLVYVMGMIAVLPILGALALGAQRMLPLLQQAYWSYSQLHGGQASLCDVLELLNQALPDDQYDSMAIGFSREIELCNIEFSYVASRSKILDKVNLRIPKGACVGIIGETGSGKSTLIDIIMGLISPTNGSLIVDGVPIGQQELRSWQRHIAHVPQSIYLSDASISQNIAFGVPPEQIDMARVIHAARQAQIANVIESWDEGYETLVGEHGARLSGGQRQRIGIARALYRDADIIVFDEATSALDSITEAAVMKSINSLDNRLTIIIIAHRLSTLQGCDFIVEVVKGKLLNKPVFSARSRTVDE